jgi:hypothetical protein
VLSVFVMVISVKGRVCCVGSLALKGYWEYVALACWLFLWCFGHGCVYLGDECLVMSGDPLV